MRVWREEIFGPVLAACTFSSEEEAVRLANDSEFGLAAAVISADPERCRWGGGGGRAGQVCGFGRVSVWCVAWLCVYVCVRGGGLSTLAPLHQAGGSIGLVRLLVVGLARGTLPLYCARPSTSGSLQPASLALPPAGRLTGCCNPRARAPAGAWRRRWRPAWCGSTAASPAFAKRPGAASRTAGLAASWGPLAWTTSCRSSRCAGALLPQRCVELI